MTGQPETSENDFGVYVHIPFCAAKCDYCAFATWTDRHHLIEEYLAAVATEIRRAVDDGMPAATSVFVGGGTPTLVPAERLAAVIASIPTAGRRTPGASSTSAPVEITVECNPDDVTIELLRTYRDVGVNRVSVGVQSTRPHVLAELGRSHRGENIVASVDAIRSVGLDSYNLDLIYGARSETEADWEATIADVLALEPPHVSAYGLTVEAGTPIAVDPRRHPDSDDQASKYENVDDRLTAAGLANYEISNWARAGHECRHNQLYWKQGNYRGFGCAAHSHHDGDRWWNLRTPQRYIDAIIAGAPTRAAGERLDHQARSRERLELALRTSAGVPAAALDGQHLDGLVELVESSDGDRWVLTRRGRLLANEVSLRLRLLPGDTVPDATVG